MTGKSHVDRNDPPLVLLTGVAGHAGKGIAAILKKEFRVRGLDIRPCDDTDEMLVGSVADFSLCVKAVQGVSSIVIAHMAPRPVSYSPPFECIDVNIRGTLNLYQAVVEAGLKNIVLISSASVLPTGAVGSESPADINYGAPYNIYSLTKVVQEMIAHYFHARHAISTRMLRPSWIVRESDRKTKYNDVQECYSVELIDPLDLGEAVLRCLKIEGEGLEAYAIGQPGYLDTVESMIRLSWQPKHNFECLRNVEKNP